MERASMDKASLDQIKDPETSLKRLSIKTNKINMPNSARAAILRRFKTYDDYEI